MPESAKEGKCSCPRTVHWVRWTSSTTRLVRVEPRLSQLPSRNRSHEHWCSGGRAREILLQRLNRKLAASSRLLALSASYFSWFLTFIHLRIHNKHCNKTHRNWLQDKPNDCSKSFESNHRLVATWRRLKLVQWQNRQWDSQLSSTNDIRQRQCLQTPQNQDAGLLFPFYPFIPRTKVLVWKCRLRPWPRKLLLNLNNQCLCLKWGKFWCYQSYQTSRKQSSLRRQ